MTKKPMPSKTTEQAAAELNEMIDEHQRTPKKLSLGLHFGCPMDDYLRDPALSSSDLKKCAKDTSAYWWDSWMNPLRPDEEADTEARLVGRAMHTRVLEGVAEFDRYYVRGPDQRGMSGPQKGASTRAANAEAGLVGKECLKADAYGRIIVASAMITKNPALARAFTGGMAEVTFVFVHEGVRRKVRMDYLKPALHKPKNNRKAFVCAAIGDLKSVGNDRGEEFRAACYRAIAEWRYDVQAAYYLDALPHVVKAVKRGDVHCHRNPRDQVGFDLVIERIATASVPAWQWVFHQTKNAPLTHSMVISSAKNPLAETGRATYQRGIENWRAAMERWGETLPWVPDDPVHEAEHEEMPAWWAR